MPTEITRINVVSLTKWFAIAGGVYGLLWGVLAFVMFAGMAMVSMGTMGGMGDPAGFGAMGVGMGLALWAFYVVIGVVSGAITGGILAFVYNLLAGAVGGVVVALDETA